MCKWDYIKIAKDSISKLRNYEQFAGNKENKYAIDKIPYNESI